MTTATQYRAHCPICFAEQATRAKRTMVQHGYQRPEGWHQNVGECTGTNRPHFGTPEGREVAAAHAAHIRSYAAARREHAEGLRTTPPVTVEVDGKYLPKERRYEQVTIDATDSRYARRVESMIHSAEMDARHADSSAAEIERRVAKWTATEPRAVEVETGATMHAINEYMSKKAGHDVALCSSYSSRFTHSHKETSRDWTKVTCKACLKSKAASDAQAAIAEKAKALVAEMVVKYGERVLEQFSDAADKAVKEIRYQRKEVDKAVRQAACYQIEYGRKS